jgi:hypothetical protein
LSDFSSRLILDVCATDERREIDVDELLEEIVEDPTVRSIAIHDSETYHIDFIVE